jgi:hypothetical protein
VTHPGGERFERRRLRARHLALVVAVWSVATLIGLGVAAKTSVGPVVLRLSKNHGVHVGDLVCFAGCYMGALGFTANILRFHRQ